MDGLAQEKDVLTSYNMALMAQLQQLTAMMDYMQEHMKKVRVSKTNKRKH